MKNTVRCIFLLGIMLSGCRPSEESIRNAMWEKKIVSHAKTIGPYSPAVRVGNFLFVSGQIALDQQTGQLKNESIEIETRKVLDNIRTTLALEGFDSSHVVNATVYLKNMSDFQKMNGIYAQYFQEGNYPARTTVEVSELPRQANVEIAVIACKTE